MDTCGIEIGPDCESLIMDYVAQLKHTEKFSKCIDEIKKITHFNYYCPFITSNKISRLQINKKIVEYRNVEFINYGLLERPSKYSELMIHCHNTGLYLFIK